MMSGARPQWQSRMGFVLAASGSAIGLGNIVFFAANAYKYGAGSFYLPYLIALLLVGIPVMALEFGLGKFASASLPVALGRIAGRWGEAAGWWAVLNAALVTMYYVTILGWVAGMWWGATSGSLWQASVAVPAFGLAEGALANPISSFFALLSSHANLVGVVLVWALNLALLVRGTRSIEPALKALIPLMWVLMAALCARGLTLDGGLDGMLLLFTPEPSTLALADTWRGAFSQMFFTLSLGLGIMTTYASYLPKSADHVTNSVVVSTLNCSFELLAGIAIFSLLFATALVPKASTLSMMFFIVPTGIAALPAGAPLFGALFFTLLLLAGLSSSVSLIEGLVAALIDRLGLPRKRALAIACGFGFVGSAVFALPHVVDPALNGNGTLGLSLLDLIDHYAFSYGLMVVGVLQCLIVGWGLPKGTLRHLLNETTSLKLGPWFDVLVRWIIPGALSTILVSALANELQSGALYGASLPLEGWSAAPLGALLFWAIAPLAASIALSRAKSGAPKLRRSEP